jgi:quinoprotein glucose dehydrogenase
MSSPAPISARRRVLLALVTIAVLSIGTVPGGQTRQKRTTWRDYGGGPDNARYVELDEINKGTLGRLDVAWTYQTRDNLPYNFGPLVVDNVAYVLARNNSLVALDAATGQELWVHADLQGIAPRGINYWESSDRKDRRLLFQRSSFLEAIDAQTGRSILSFGTDGAVDLKEGYSRDAAALTRVQSSNPGKVFENLLILGSATGEGYFSTPGDIRAYDVITGKEVWRFHTIPQPGEFGYETWPPDAWKYVGGTNAWGELTVDPVRGTVFVPTGSPTYDFYGADRLGANLFGTSLIALDARTGKRRWHFQMVHHDLWDYDNTAAPVLTTIRRNGKPVDVVAQAGKTGFLYVFDRATGEPIWPIEERPVAKSDMPGEQAWPTQPYPTNPPPFAQQKLTPADVNPYILTAQEQDDWKKRIDSARNNGLFTPPARSETISFPGAQGGANWGTTASNPTNGTVYVLSINVPSFYKLDLEPPPPAVPAGGAAAPVAVVQRGQAVYVQRCQSCHSPTLEGNGVNVKSLVGITSRMGQNVIREVVTGGRPGMPAFNDIPEAEMTALLAFLGSPNAAGRGGPPPRTPVGGVVVASGGAPGNKPAPPGRAGGMGGLPYPPGIAVPSVRYYTGYGMVNNLVKPPYSTLTAYDLNKGTIKWQVPAGGDEPEAIRQGGRDTGFIRIRSGIISTSAGLVFHAGGDGKLRAYAADTGRVLWTGALPAGSQGIPAMYETGGRQFLLVNATQIGSGYIRGQTRPGDTPAGGYVAFAVKPERGS